MAACAAAAVLTAVLARAEYFTLAPAGTTLELSDDGSWSTTSGPGSSGSAQLMGLQVALPPASSLHWRQKTYEAAADGCRRQAWAQPGLPFHVARFSADNCRPRVESN